MLQLSSGGRYIKGAKANHTISRHYCISKISLLRADKMTSGLFYLDTLIGGYGCERLLKGGINKGRGNNSLIMPNILLHCIAHGRTRSGRVGGWDSMGEGFDAMQTARGYKCLSTQCARAFMCQHWRSI